MIFFQDGGYIGSGFMVTTTDPFLNNVGQYVGALCKYLKLCKHYVFSFKCFSDLTHGCLLWNYSPHPRVNRLNQTIMGEKSYIS